ncbi:hypothetical protein KUCAC02_029478, partial [Chaenocephalus aceratus]
QGGESAVWFYSYGDDDLNRTEDAEDKCREMKKAERALAQILKNLTRRGRQISRDLRIGKKGPQ